MENQNTIFLAHASEDKPFVRNLYRMLKENGLNPWIDEEDLPPAVPYDKYIHNVIEQSRFFVICISRQSVHKIGYVQKEIKRALKRLEEMPAGYTYIIPALMDDIELPDISVGTVNLIDYQAARLFSQKGLLKFVRFLQQEINGAGEIKLLKKSVFDEIKENIANNYVDTSLEMLERYVKNRNGAENYLKPMNIIIKKYNELEDQNLLGVLSRSDYRQESAILVVSILTLIEKMEKSGL